MVRNKLNFHEDQRIAESSVAMFKYSMGLVQYIESRAMNVRKVHLILVDKGLPELYFIDGVWLVSVRTIPAARFGKFQLNK
jgi:hypothetical protein